MKKILMIGTGGTIASELTASGLSPELTSEQILEYIPSIKNFCEVGCVKSVILTVPIFCLSTGC